MLTEPFRDSRFSRTPERYSTIPEFQTRERSEESDEFRRKSMDEDEAPSEEAQEQPWLDIDFDLTPTHLMRLFTSINKGKKPYTTYEETVQCLEIVSRSLPGGANSLFDYEYALQIVKICDMDKSGNISAQEFVNTVQTFAMSYLLSEPQGEVYNFFCFDYDQERAQCRHIDPDAWDSTSARPGTISFREFLEEDHSKPRYSESTVRWIHLSGTKIGTIITLGNKYGLHPLTIEDILNHDERPRLETNSDRSTHLILSVLTPLQEAMSQQQQQQQQQQQHQQHHQQEHQSYSMNSRFGSGEYTPPHIINHTQGHAGQVHAFKGTEIKQKYWYSNDTSTVRKDRSGSLSPSSWWSKEKKHEPKYRLQLYSHQFNIILVNERTVLSFQKKPSDLLDPLLSRIAYHGSKIRMNNAPFLIYSMIDKVIDGLFPVLKEYQRELRKLQAAVHSTKTTELSTVKQVQHINREMNYAILWLKPMEGIVTKMVEHFPNDPELKRHLQDLKDHVQTLIDQANTMITWSQSLNDDYLNEQQCRMNQVMYVLTLVTTLFIPAQFLAGVYGMNFVYMPALNYHWGYFYFWAGVLLISSGVLFGFHRQGWISWSN